MERLNMKVRLFLNKKAFTEILDPKKFSNPDAIFRAIESVIEVITQLIFANLIICLDFGISQSVVLLKMVWRYLFHPPQFYES